jgi:hypothetical protein
MVFVTWLLGRFEAKTDCNLTMLSIAELAAIIGKDVEITFK